MTPPVLATALAGKLRAFDVATTALTQVVNDLRTSTQELAGANEDLHERLKAAAILHLDALHMPALLCTLQGVTRVNQALAERLGCVPPAYEGHAWPSPRDEKEPAPALWTATNGAVVRFSWYAVALNNGQFFCYDATPTVPEVPHSSGA